MAMSPRWTWRPGPLTSIVAAALVASTILAGCGRTSASAAPPSPSASASPAGAIGPTSSPGWSPLPRPLTPEEATAAAVAFVAAKRGVDAPGLRVLTYASLLTDEGSWWAAKIGAADSTGLDSIVVDLLTGRVFDESEPMPSGRPYPVPGTSPEDRPRLAPGVLAWLDQVDPVEIVTVTVEAVDPEGLAAAARGLGLAPAPSGGFVAGPPDLWIYTGPPDAIRAFLASERILRASVTEDRSPFRPVADPWPAGTSLPRPGQPYLDGVAGIPVSWSGIDWPAPGPADREAIVAAVAARIWTIDGRPYDRANLSVRCDAPGRCRATFEGSFLPAPDEPPRDNWSFDIVGPGTWSVTPTQDGWLNAVPRALEREAERIARAEPDVLRRLADADAFGGATWSPATPGVITVSYGFPLPCCDAALAVPLGHTAATESASLTVVVDLERQAVVRILPDGSCGSCSSGRIVGGPGTG